MCSVHVRKTSAFWEKSPIGKEFHIFKGMGTVYRVCITGGGCEGVCVCVGVYRKTLKLWLHTVPCAD